MNKKQLIVGWTTSIVLLSGCTTEDNPQSLNKIQQSSIKKIMDEAGAVSYDTKELDLDRDGKEEVIAIYGFPPHNSGVKVIKFEGDKINILFDEICSTPKANFEVINNIPTIILEQSDYTPDYATGNRYTEIYEWDGDIFRTKE